MMVHGFGIGAALRRRGLRRDPDIFEKNRMRYPAGADLPIRA
jgi:hypothetical protein